MLTADLLIKELSSIRGAKFIENLSEKVIRENFDINQLVDLTFHQNQQTGFRACWLLDSVMHLQPEKYAANVGYIISRMPEVTNPSCERHFARVLMLLTRSTAPDNIREQLNNINLEQVVEKCFDWLINPGVKVAVKATAAEVLFNLTPRYDWIKEELANQMQFLMRNGTAAIQARGKKLLALIQN
ncbi:hypothetical protein CKK33_11110 [Mucilaginibacter sp. MD40]|uniref:hypothetical protein n=1 Tax=Mucilaginibacter sp. MD40 TaxID=2029590 RepID=UPI000BAC5F3D|nr:hypothetical protein [Mucilaginibacter sp. MD40]PAW94011.1 hypothetical protein CKK33_11110 [Mucilaginibacter sp. MD40]